MRMPFLYFKYILKHIMISGGVLMRKMLVEKQLYFDEKVNEIIQLYVSEDLSYEKSDEGIRATGPIKMMGECISNQQTFRFEEMVDMDILAPSEKLTNEPFSMVINDFYSKVENGECYVFVEFVIEGLKEENIESVNKNEILENRVTEISDTSVLDEKVKGIENDDISDVSDVEILDIDKEFEDLFEDDENLYISYQMVVCKEYDTYETIAQRYKIDEVMLRNVNGNKIISPKSLIILP